MKTSIFIYRTLILALPLLLLSLKGEAQRNQLDTTGLIQFSGVVVTDENGMVQPLPYVNIFIKGSSGRGTYTSNDGFFSIVAREGETVIFSSVGYESVEYVIPDTLSSSRYSFFQIMTQDTVLLPETVIYPWPSREHFKLEFLAMDVSTEMESRADANLADKVIADMVSNLPTDGTENASMYMRQQQQAYYYEGQIRPQNVFNAFAWAEFIKAMKRGDFKKKKKD